MATKVIMVVSGEEEMGVAISHYLSEDWDTVIDRLYPIQQPGSALENRANCTFINTDGNRVWIQAHMVATVRENVEVPS